MISFNDVTTTLTPISANTQKKRLLYKDWGILVLKERPKYIPINAGTMAKADIKVLVIVKELFAVNAAASERVKTVNKIPIACINSSRDSRSACKYKTLGKTKEPVTPVIAPVAKPKTGPRKTSLPLSMIMLNLDRLSNA